MLHFLIVGILVIVTAILAYFGVNLMWPLPEPASVQAAPIDWMWNLQMIAMSFLFALIVVPMLYSLIVFRRKKGDTSEGEHIEGNMRLEIVWTVIPLIAVLIFAYLGAVTLADTRRVDPDAMVVNVTGRQWSWSFEYENGVVSDTLYMPVGKQVHLKMTSNDVIHSFWVPEFRVKQDLVPGRVTDLWITPTEEGEYAVRCAELCGTTHYGMVKPAIVTSQTEFATWLDEQAALAAALDTPEARGEAIVASNGCSACHSIDGSQSPLGPTWFGLAGSEVELTDGTVVTADDDFLAESIRDPQAKIVAGFETQLMPIYGFSEEQIADLVAYIKTLR
ncbi:MAG TPA: cytochrome c oxidase subunit II [Anaerolineales bacterium]|nr:cytochrome c oxidase subunit II [Anaerolineales bacterium]